MTELRSAIDHTLDALEMLNFNQGFEACMNSIDEISNRLYNQGKTTEAEALRQAVRELKGETDELV